MCNRRLRGKSLSALEHLRIEIQVHQQLAMMCKYILDLLAEDVMFTVVSE